jgi:Ni/Co efflux regulator RcnB
MKKLFATLLAATVLAAPLAAEAQSRYDNGPRHDRGRNERAVIERHVEKKVIVKKRNWKRGERLSSAQRNHYIDQREYRRYKLREPKRNERWVRVDNQFLLVNALTGLIVGLSAAR